MAAKSMQDILEGGRLKTYFDRRIIKALGHPMREHALAVFSERTASGRQIGEELGADVSLFYSHIEKLEELGCIELVETRGNRGGKERFFRAKASIMLSDCAWQELPESVKSDWFAAHAQAIWDELVEALRAETFAVDDRPHLAWMPGVFDRDGWNEAMQLMNETLIQMMAIRRRSAERVATGGEPGIPATIAMMGFGT